MSITTQNGTTKITCDSCGTSSEFAENIAGREFFNLGWQMNSRAVKYVHLCRSCQSASNRSSHDFVVKNFGSSVM